MSSKDREKEFQQDLEKKLADPGEQVSLSEMAAAKKALRNLNANSEVKENINQLAKADNRSAAEVMAFARSSNALVFGAGARLRMDRLGNVLVRCKTVHAEESGNEVATTKAFVFAPRSAFLSNNNILEALEDYIADDIQLRKLGGRVLQLSAENYIFWDLNQQLPPKIQPWTKITQKQFNTIKTTTAEEFDDGFSMGSNLGLMNDRPALMSDRMMISDNASDADCSTLGVQLLEGKKGIRRDSDSFSQTRGAIETAATPKKQALHGEDVVTDQDTKTPPKNTTQRNRIQGFVEAIKEQDWGTAAIHVRILGSGFENPAQTDEDTAVVKKMARGIGGSLLGIVPKTAEDATDMADALEVFSKKVDRSECLHCIKALLNGNYEEYRAAYAACRVDLRAHIDNAALNKWRLRIWSVNARIEKHLMQGDPDLDPLVLSGLSGGELLAYVDGLFNKFEKDAKKVVAHVNGITKKYALYNAVKDLADRVLECVKAPSLDMYILGKIISSGCDVSMQVVANMTTVSSKLNSIIHVVDKHRDSLVTPAMEEWVKILASEVLGVDYVSAMSVADIQPDDQARLFVFKTLFDQKRMQSLQKGKSSSLMIVVSEYLKKETERKQRERDEAKAEKARLEAVARAEKAKLEAEARAAEAAQTELMMPGLSGPGDLMFSGSGVKSAPAPVQIQNGVPGTGESSVDSKKAKAVPTSAKIQNGSAGAGKSSVDTKKKGVNNKKEEGAKTFCPGDYVKCHFTKTKACMLKEKEWYNKKVGKVVSVLTHDCVVRWYDDEQFRVAKTQILYVCDKGGNKIIEGAKATDVQQGETEATDAKQDEAKVAGDDDLFAAFGALNGTPPAGVSSGIGVPISPTPSRATKGSTLKPTFSPTPVSPIVDQKPETLMSVVAKQIASTGVGGVIRMEDSPKCIKPEQKLGKKKKKPANPKAPPAIEVDGAMDSDAEPEEYLCDANLNSPDYMHEEMHPSEVSDVISADSFIDDADSVCHENSGGANDDENGDGFGGVSPISNADDVIDEGFGKETVDPQVKATVDIILARNLYAHSDKRQQTPCPDDENATKLKRRKVAAQGYESDEDREQKKAELSNDPVHL